MIGVQELLKAEHASVARVFDVIHVPVLTHDEATTIVDLALRDTGVTIDRTTNAEIARLSAGFPHPVHLLGSEAFAADSDDNINDDDLAQGVTSVVTEKWKAEFDANLINAGSGKNRDIIKAMAQHDDADVQVAYLCDTLGVTQPEISSNINLLMTRDVIVRPDRGVYRIKDPLFRLYVRQLGVLGAEPVEYRPRKRKTSTTP
jgi:hypothetical protein